MLPTEKYMSMHVHTFTKQQCKVGVELLSKARHLNLVEYVIALFTPYYWPRMLLH